jgi:hypothetical protein
MSDGERVMTADVDASFDSGGRASDREMRIADFAENSPDQYLVVSDGGHLQSAILAPAINSPEQRTDTARNSHTKYVLFKL